MGGIKNPKAGQMENYEIPPEIEQRRNNIFETTSKQHEKVLEDLQIVLIVDKSGSMRHNDENFTGKQNPGFEGGPWTRWDNTFLLAKDLADSLFQYDKDSEIPVIFFGNNVKALKATSSSQLLSLFKKNAPTTETTNLLAALRTAFVQNINAEEQTLFIVLTDGRPNQGQEKKVKDLIHEMVTKEDPSGDRLNVLFIRIGDDPGAIEFLQDLDDCIKIGDNVDTKSDNEAFALGPRCLVLNAIFEHLEDDMEKYISSSSSSSSFWGSSSSSSTSSKKGGDTSRGIVVNNQTKGGGGGGGGGMLKATDLLWVALAVA
eukprot:CAMPEP_0201509530 /NCGR_PEP_ID=MMETSP0161_2-20130828/2560_1 /ASSEMBLY_ACC=CAM_ASM_000251 /TAXON_ID=180227 /ORGANISM="Neoparamoeba aestuarina, Strain SoJaBio B1-5/56/2" /LENGTH=315 /DNA_ID=CAMNT_0047904507 /DNA_START=105 /DNA_END=1048 /DNA_ORIENTATION=+